MTRAEQRSIEAYPTQDKYSEYLDGSNALKRDVFIQGYEQAEKDINKELMDKMAEIREKQNKDAFPDYDIHIDTSNCSDTSLGYFFKGDKIVNALTWEDMKTIHHIAETMKEYIDDGIIVPFGRNAETFYEEVLRRFKENRK